MPLPTGVGLIGWILDRTEVSDDPRIPMVLDEMPVVIWLAFGDNLGQYVSQVRTYDEKRAHKTLVFVIVNSVAEAKRAAIDWKVDAIVVQGMLYMRIPLYLLITFLLLTGMEAGGHGSSASPPLFTFIQAVLMALPNGPPILAAGGVSTGAQIASLLTLGAAGVVLGTRFLFTRECMYSDEMKAILVDAGLYSTARNSVFDEVNGTPPRTTWPEGIDGRAVANKIITDYESGLSMEERLVKFQSGQKDGDKERLLIWAGIGSGLVNEIKGASVSSQYSRRLI